MAVSYSGKRAATDRIRPGDAVGRVADCVSRLDVFLELDRKHLPAGQVHAYRRDTPIAIIALVRLGPRKAARAISGSERESSYRKGLGNLGESSGVPCVWE